MSPSIRTWLLLPLLWLAVGSNASALVRVRQTLSIPMRDGQFLAGDAWLPAASGNWPVILIQTPYNKNVQGLVFQNVQSTDVLFDNVNYAFVLVDWRGYFGSGNADYSGNPTRGQDGYDTVQWVSAQSWCDGKVGTWGASALGTAQLLTALEQPPALRACVPIVAQLGVYYSDWYPGGVWQTSVNDFRVSYFGLSLYRNYPLYNTFWRVAEQLASFTAFDVPMLHITGWFDHHTDETFLEINRLMSEAQPGVRNQQWTLIGPWSHGGINQTTQGGYDFPAAAGEANTEAVRFFDYYLRNEPNGWPQRPAWRWFRINAERWVGAAHWPPAVTTRTLYLASGGRLEFAAPTTTSAQRAFPANPADPVHPIWAPVLENAQYATQGVGDISPIESRADVVTFTTPPLNNPLIIEGESVAHLWLSSTAPDCDLTVRLTQALPDGRSILMVDGVRRASLRNGYTKRELLTPGTIYAVEVRLPAVALQIPAGGQLRLTISASNYDQFDINPQDGSTFTTDPGAVLTPATLSLRLDAAHSSRIDLPVIPFTPARNWAQYE